MSRRLRVQHWVACLEAGVVPPAGPNNFYNLLRVGYTHTVPADTEFPWAFPRLDMFARFYGGKGTCEFEIRVDWIDALEGSRLIDFFGPFRVAFRPNEPARDVTFRLLNVPTGGVGRLEIVLLAIRPRRRPPLAREYVTVVRQP